MEKITYIFLLVFACLSSHVHAQKGSYIRAGLIRTQLTFSPTYMFAQKQSYFYLHGSSEVYFSRKLSFSGDCNYFLGSGSPNNKIFDHNHNVFWGPFWHFTQNNNDFYTGFQTGVSLTRVNKTTANLPQTHLGVNPMMAVVVGYNFYVYQFFHFFVQSRYLLGEHNYDVHKNLSEFRFSAGLGFNLNTMKEK